MRLIKFRAWIKNPVTGHGFMISWESLQGAFGHRDSIRVAETEASNIISQSSLSIPHREVLFYETISGNVFADTRLSIMQFTGLLDKHNGILTEIYV